MSSLLLTLVACEPYGDGVPPPEPGPSGQEALVVTPGLIDFGTLSVINDGYATATFTVDNAGTDTVTVHGHDEVSGDGVFSVAADPILTLEPGDSRDLVVVFAPETEGRYAGRISVNYGVETLQLRGSAVSPVIAVESPIFDAIPVGCVEQSEITVRNDGTERLELGDVFVSAASDFAVGEPSRTLLSTGEEIYLPVTFVPSWDPRGLREATLQITSNDPLNPSWDETLSGVGQTGEQVEEEFIYAPGAEADLLIMIDTDGVMGAQLVKAEESMPNLVASLADGNVDAHIAMAGGASFCSVLSEPWVDNSGSSTELLATLRAGLETPAGDHSDRLLFQAAAVLANDTNEGCMEGFLREGAQLQVLVIAGTPENSGLAAEALVTGLLAAAPGASDVVVSVLVVTESEGCGGGDFGDVYIDAAVHTGGDIHNMCDADWDAAFEAVAMISTASGEGGLSYVLGQTPVEETIEVRVDGLSFHDWAYADGTLSFDAETAPSAGAEVHVEYKAALPCD